MKTKAVTLLSGGLDSYVATTMAMKKYDVHAITVHYGQKHDYEVHCAAIIARQLGIPVENHKIIRFQQSFALASFAHGTESPEGCPKYYTPARNSIFLSIATAYAESIGARKIIIGANADDYMDYPDCRDHFYRAFEEVIRLGTFSPNLKIEAPLIDLSKGQVLDMAEDMGLDPNMYWTCYDPQPHPDDETQEPAPCGECDSCKLIATASR